jgi:hypothetical protein
MPDCLADAAFARRSEVGPGYAMDFLAGYLAARGGAIDEDVVRIALLAGEPALAGVGLRQLVQAAGSDGPARMARVAAFWAGWMPGAVP